MHMHMHMHAHARARPCVHWRYGIEADIITASGGLLDLSLGYAVELPEQLLPAAGRNRRSKVRLREARA